MTTSSGSFEWIFRQQKAIVYIRANFRVNIILVKLAWSRYTLEFSVVKEWVIDNFVLIVDCSWFRISQERNVTGLTVTVSTYNFKIKFQM
jgi:hypothetical protein